MFGENRNNEGWSPFSVGKKQVDTYVAPKPGEAVVIFPIVIMSNVKRAVATPVAPEEDEAEAPAEIAPKERTSSVTSIAEVSDSDSLTSGSEITTNQNLIHPSFLAPEEDSPVSVKKDLNQPQGLLIMPMNLG